MRRYVHALIGLTTVAVLGAPASANDEPASQPRPKPTCHLLVDSVGDRELPADELEILSGDVATSLSVLVGVLRLKGLSAGEPATVAGANWTFGFYVDIAKYELAARRDALGAVSATMTRNGVSLGNVKVTLDPARREVRWEVLRAQVVDLPAVTGTTVLHTFTAVTSATAANLTADTASSGAKYVDGNPSCVRVG